MQAHLRAEHADLAIQAGADHLDDLARVGGALIDQRQQHAEDAEVRIELLANGGDGFEDLRQTLHRQEVGLDGDDDAVGGA
jgi:hypothetical protein